MISYIRHNSVFDLGSRTGTSTCVGLYKELDDIYSKYFNPQVHVQYNDTDCLCNMSGKQTLSGGSHAFVFHNDTISVTVDEQDNVTVADSGSGGGGGGSINVTATSEDEYTIYTLDKTYSEIIGLVNQGILPVVIEQLDSGVTIKPLQWYGPSLDYTTGYDLYFDPNTFYAEDENAYPSYRQGK